MIATLPTIRAGIDWSATLTVTDPDSGDPLNLAGGGYELRAQVRANVAADVVLHEWTTEDNTITTDSDGQVTLASTAEVTAGMTWAVGYYDLVLIYPSGRRVLLAEGVALVVPTITERTA
jgi:hypothetical protein